MKKEFRFGSVLGDNITRSFVEGGVLKSCLVSTMWNLSLLDDMVATQISHNVWNGTTT